MADSLGFSENTYCRYECNESDLYLFMVHAIIVILFLKTCILLKSRDSTLPLLYPCFTNLIANSFLSDQLTGYCSIDH